MGLELILVASLAPFVAQGGPFSSWTTSSTLSLVALFGEGLSRGSISFFPFLSLRLSVCCFCLTFFLFCFCFLLPQ